VAGRDAARQKEVWKGFAEWLAEVTGKAVEQQTFTGVEEQLKSLKEGRLHVTGLNAGSVPLAVNACGFVPLCTVGREDGTFGYTMEIIVPADSPIRRPADLRGRRITFTRLVSNSGFKAPVVILRSEFGLEPGRDYDWAFSYGHGESIRMVAGGKCQAAPVASDMLAMAIEQGTVDPASIRSIYRSERFPPAAIGCLYCLKPELVAKICTALLDCDWKKTGLIDELGSSGETRFMPISYKDDWAAIRRIDDLMGHLHAVQ
jgi:phosphonate transport system substrate-binding protein